MDPGLNAIELDRIYREVRHGLLGEPQQHLRIGRRVVLRRLGAGSSGLVYAARDPVLDREVALKVFRPGSDLAAWRAEARALAAVSHPHVVSIFEIGDSDWGPYIVMELIDGATLSRWLEAWPRSTTEISEMFAKISEGLAAVHAAGLTHGDVKPDNILVGQDGRPRLVDFGLANPATLGATHLGTPGYRAPEIARGGPSTPRSDQYALFVSLRLALEGRRIPRWMARSLVVGLDPDPNRRHADMSAVATVLRTGDRRFLLPPVIGVAIVIAGIWVLTEEPVDCSDAPKLPGVADDLPQLLAAHASDVGSSVGLSIQRTTDQYVRRWSDAFHQICAATWDEGTQSEALLDARMACLAGLRSDYEATLEALDPAEPTTTAMALESLDGLADPIDCTTRPAASDASASEDPALRHDLARARALRRIGKYDVARPAILRVVDAAPDPSALLADALLEQAAIDVQAEGPTSSTATLERAARAAHEIGRVDLEARAWLSLAFVAAERGGDPEQGRAYWHHARTSVELAGTPRDRVRLLNIEGLLARMEGDLDRSEATWSRALAAAEGLEPAEPALVATLLTNLANVAADRGDASRARALRERALDLRLRVLGPAHPDVALSHMNLGLDSVHEGRDQEALQHFDAVIEVAEQAVGLDAPGLARAYLPRADVLLRIGERDRARADLERALELATEGGRDELAERARIALLELESDSGEGAVSP